MAIGKGVPFHLTGADAKAYEMSRRESLAQAGSFAIELGEAVLSGKVAIHELDPKLSTYELFRVENYVTQVGQGRALRHQVPTIHEQNLTGHVSAKIAS